MAHGNFVRLAAPLLPRAVLVGLVYAALAALSDKYFYSDPARFLAFWLPAGFTLALLLRTPARTWPAWLAAIFFTETLLQLLVHGRPAPIALAWGIADSMEPLLGASLLRAVLRRPVTLTHPREVLALVGLGALLPAMVSGLLAAAAAARWLAPDVPFLTWWTSWWLGDALGVVLVGPFFLTVFPLPRIRFWRRVEAVVLLLLLAVLSQWVFSIPSVPGTRGLLPTVFIVLYAAFGFFVWAALRFGVLGVSTATGVLAFIAGWNAGRGLGPFQLSEATPHEALVATQAFLAVFSILALMLAAALRERRRVERGQRLLADASAILAESLDDMALARVARRVVPELADACVLSLRHGGPSDLVPVGVAGERNALEWLLPRRDSDATRPMATTTVAAAASPREGMQLTLPLDSQGHVLGQLALFRTAPGRGFEREDRALAEELARRCSLMIERAQLHDQLAGAVRRAQESLAQLDTVLQTALIGFAFFDADLRCLRANEAFLHLLGLGGDLPEERRAGDICSDLVPLLHRTLQLGEPVMERELENRSFGEERYLLASGFPVRSSAGRAPFGAGVLVHDITDRKRMEGVHTRLLREARAAIRARDEFLTLAAHELKTPLTPLAIRMESLAGRLRPDHPAEAKTLDGLRAHVRRLQRLIEHLLEAAQVDTGQLSIRLAPVPLHALVRSISTSFPRLGTSHVLDLQTGGCEVWVLGDRLRLEEVLLTLLENAVKYSPEGGTIRMTLGMAGDEVQVAVSDPGVGIPPEQRAHVFDRYFRGSNTPVQSYGGLGLGLYLCRNILESHGGRIWVDSEVGQGSTFTFSLPLLRATKAPPRHETAPSPWAS
ncbi:MASE1 domain-containing protein [Myxococcus sp. RHSTA-1-4]|uniref:MASE1 domain-containing protein n=1 Tax=Myxococcus sp. RHSTA-1-4 TaxID=2874601 RepID=UPI001CC06EC7|nr:MASE1 domain-containing protein [Myxococcus sp. RHSTA-1-4]MBZ4418444.1 MASE1 domain-containing protein [Myxococcus sp. RHSTA-1-4]